MRHVHADLMLEYAKDAQETDKPWERWEVKTTFPEAVWTKCNRSLLFDINNKYRRIDPYRKFREAQERGETVWRKCYNGKWLTQYDIAGHIKTWLFTGPVSDFSLTDPTKAKAEDMVDEITSSLMDYLKERPEKLKEVAREFGIPVPPEKPKTKKMWKWFIEYTLDDRTIRFKSDYMTQEEFEDLGILATRDDSTAIEVEA